MRTTMLRLVLVVLIVLLISACGANAQPYQRYPQRYYNPNQYRTLQGPEYDPNTREGYKMNYDRRIDVNSREGYKMGPYHRSQVDPNTSYDMYPQPIYKGPGHPGGSGIYVQPGYTPAAGYPRAYSGPGIVPSGPMAVPTVGPIMMITPKPPSSSDQSEDPGQPM